MTSQPPSVLPPELLNSLFALYWEEEMFLGTAFAIAPRVAITAGHHIRINQDDCGLLSLRALKEEEDDNDSQEQEQEQEEDEDEESENEEEQHQNIKQKRVSSNQKNEKSRIFVPSVIKSNLTLRIDQPPESSSSSATTRKEEVEVPLKTRIVFNSSHEGHLTGDAGIELNQNERSKNVQNKKEKNNQQQQQQNNHTSSKKDSKKSLKQTELKQQRRQRDVYYNTISSSSESESDEDDENDSRIFCASNKHKNNKKQQKQNQNQNQENKMEEEEQKGKSTQNKKKSIAAQVSFVQKESNSDILILWLDRCVETYYPLRAHHPCEGTPVVLISAAVTKPHTDIVVSAGKVIHSSPFDSVSGLCRASGCVSARGYSGSVVLELVNNNNNNNNENKNKNPQLSNNDNNNNTSNNNKPRIVGMHISVFRTGPSNAAVVEFVSSYRILKMMSIYNVDPCSDYAVGKDDEE